MAEYYNSGKYRKKKHYKYRPRGKSSVSALGVVLIVLGVCGITIGVLFCVNKFTNINVGIFDKETDVAEATPTPMPTEHPIETIDTDSLRRDVTITDTAFQWFSDSCAANGEIMFTAGEISGGDARMTAILSVRTGNDENHMAQRVNVIKENDDILYPVFNENWLVFLDAKASGGGKIVCYKYGSYEKPVTVKTVYTGHPKLFLSGNYLVWTERTGTSMDKLFVCDLTTLESATVQKFEQATCYGISNPYIEGNKLIWADVDTENTSGVMTSQICVLDIETGEYVSYKPDMYVHDPKISPDGVLAWMDANHGPETALYIMKDDAPEKIAEGIVDFDMDDDIIAYQKDSAIHVYVISASKSYTLTSNMERTQLMSVSDYCVVWNDVTSAERESVKFAVIPH